MEQEQLKGGVWVKASDIDQYLRKMKVPQPNTGITLALLIEIMEGFANEFSSELIQQNQNLYEINKKVIDEFEEIKQQNQQLQEDYNIQEYKLSQCVKDNISLNGKITELQAEKEKLMADNKLYGDIAVVILQAEKEKLMSDYKLKNDQQ